MKNQMFISYCCVLGMVFVVSGCNLKLDTQIPVLPNLKGELPNHSGIEVNSANPNAPTTTSQEAGKTGTKTAILNLKISTVVIQETGMKSDVNCVQLAQLESGSVIVDFSNQPCPADNTQTVNSDSIRFTATYHQLSENDYELLVHGSAIGLMRINFDVPQILLESLCSGSYDSRCFLSTTPGGKVDNILTF